MRLVWCLVAAIGLLVGAGLAYERFTPPNEVTQPITPHGAILTGGMAQPALASELALPTPTRLPPIPLAPSATSANLAQPDNASGPALAQTTAPAANATRNEPAGGRAGGTVQLSRPQRRPGMKRRPRRPL